MQDSANFSFHLHSQSPSSSVSVFEQDYEVEPPKKTRRFQHFFEVDTFIQQPPQFAGKNTLFGRFRASFFLLNFDFSKNLHVVTNNTKLKQFSFNTDRRRPNHNFVFSNFVNGVFRFLNFHKQLSSDVRQKYFSIVRRHMNEQYQAICRRLENAEIKNNNQTRTFFRFSVNNYTYYFGFYLPCISSSCCIPPTSVTKHGPRCWIHWKKFCQDRTPNPRLYSHEMSNIPKLITSLRLDVSYTKEISFSERLNKYFVVYKNFKCLPNISKQQIARFDRLTRSPMSNDFKKLITANKSHVAQSCKHQPLPRRLQTVRDLSLPPPEPSPDSITRLVSLAMPDLKIQETWRISHLAHSESCDCDDPQLHQQQPIVRHHEEPAPSAAADFDPIVETLPVPEGFVRRHRPNK
jgi:hypothetical protein